MLKPYPPVAQNVIIFRVGLLKRLLVKMKPLGMSLKQSNWCPYKKRRMLGYTKETSGSHSHRRKTM